MKCFIRGSQKSWSFRLRGPHTDRHQSYDCFAPALSARLISASAPTKMAAAAEVAPVQHRWQAAAAALQAVAEWLGALVQILLQIIRGTPTPSSWARLLAFLGFGQPLFPASSQPQQLPEVSFVQLTSQAPADASPPPLRRLTVVLDLDETLVSAYGSSSLPASLRTQAVEAGLHCFDMEGISSDKDNRVTVFERPGLHEFLQQTSEFADLILFTAGSEGYAKPVVDRIDAHNKFCRRLYRPSTVTTKYREHVKDLSCLSKDLRRIVLVDNNPYSFLLQPLNGIPCVAFSAAQPVDDQLMGVIFPLLKHLSLENDVRHALYETFHMPEWFQRQGIPQIDEMV